MTLLSLTTPNILCIFCISPGVQRTQSSSLDDIIVSLLSSDSHVTLVFMRKPLDLLNAKKARGAAAEGLFFILGNYVLDLATLDSTGVMAMLPDVGRVEAFDDYMGNKSLATDMSPWFQDYYGVSLWRLFTCATNRLKLSY